MRNVKEERMRMRRLRSREGERAEHERRTILVSRRRIELGPSNIEHKGIEQRAFVDMATTSYIRPMSSRRLQVIYRPECLTARVGACHRRSTDEANNRPNRPQLRGRLRSSRDLPGDLGILMIERNPFVLCAWRFDLKLK